MEEEDKKLREYEEYTKKPYEVLEVFNDFFGEEFVDMQGMPGFEEYCKYRENVEPSDIFNNVFILVYFPTVRVTNENGRYVDIKQLFAKIKINYKGKMIGRFLLNRAEYTTTELRCRYMHSHVNSIPQNNWGTFQPSCLGNGPIGNTCSTLNMECDLDIWKLFCLELNNYVSIESLEGGPYHKLESLSNESGNTHNSFDFVNVYRDKLYYLDTSSEFRQLIRGFIRHYISMGFLKFNFIRGEYKVAMPWKDFVIGTSNIFIDFCNKKLNDIAKKHLSPDSPDSYYRAYIEPILDKGILKDDGIFIRNNYTIRTYPLAVGIHPDKTICKFKGQDVHLVITKEGFEENNTITIIKLPILYDIIETIIKVLNYNHGKSRREDSQGGISVERFYI